MGLRISDSLFTKFFTNSSKLSLSFKIIIYGKEIALVAGSR